jgi:hypothetical protein
VSYFDIKFWMGDPFDGTGLVSIQERIDVGLDRDKVSITYLDSAESITEEMTRKGGGVDLEHSERKVQAQ